jgi:deoxycytidylate deaminase
MDKVKTREVQQCLLYNFKLPIFPLAPTEKQIQDYVNQQLLMSLQRSAAMNRQAGGLIVDDCSQEQLTKNLLKLVEKLF